MTTISNTISPVLTTADHLLPILITLIVCVGIWAVITHLRQLEYIALVAEATDDEGVEDLAMYMAEHNGGKHIDTTAHWESFIPAARSISEQYHSK